MHTARVTSHPVRGGGGPGSPLHRTVSGCGAGVGAAGVSATAGASAIDLIVTVKPSVNAKLIMRGRTLTTMGRGYMGFGRRGK